MELVYLWVEKYKKTNKEGFNFNSKFHCDYKDDRLTIKSKKLSKLQLFDENISVTAIIGKNGAGKSTLITLLMGSIFQNNQNYRDIKALIIVYKVNEKFVVFSSSDLKSNSQINFTSNVKMQKESLYQFVDGKLRFHNLFKNNYHLLMDFSIGQIDLYNKDNKSLYKKYYAVEPSRNYLSSGPGSVSKIEPTSFESNLRANILYLYKYIEEKQILELDIPKFNKLVYYGRRRMGEKTKKTYTEDLKGKKILGIDFTNISSFEDVSKKIISFFTIKKVIYFKDINTNELEDISKLFVFANIGFESETVNENFWSISTGQKQLISYFGIIIRTLIEKVNSKDKTLTIIIDEIETSLHPQWQKMFLFLLLQLIKSLKVKHKNIQLILAGHSPFIVSDLPKENIVFLENNRQISPFKKLQTFGSNIHTLLTDSFFMSDGLMGEFAKGKIEEIKKFYDFMQKFKDRINENKSVKERVRKHYLSRKKKFEHIQSIIGEPFLQTVIKNYLDELYLIFSDDNTLIDKELEELQKRQEYLKSLKND